MLINIDILKRFRENLPTDLEVTILSKSQIKRVRKVQLFDWFIRFQRQVPIRDDLIEAKAAVVSTRPGHETSRDFDCGLETFGYRATAITNHNQMMQVLGICRK